MSSPASPAPSDPPAAARRAAAGQDGFTLIEVIVSALIVALVSVAAATAFISSLDTSGNQRIRAEAQALAEQNQDKLRGLTVDELSNLDKTLPAVTLQNTQFTVQESASYISDASGTPSCTNPSADYLKTTSTVTWANMGSQPPVTVNSVLTPTIGSVDPTHGTLAVSVDGATGAGVAGMNVAINSATANYSASGQTASDGCVLFGDLPAESDYTVSVTPVSGTYVDGKTGQAVTVSQADTQNNIQVTAGSVASASATFDIDQAGAAPVQFKDVFPTLLGVSPNPAPPAEAPAVVFFTPSLNTPSDIVCSAVDAACPAVGAGDASFAAGAWSTGFSATPLFPYTYSTYAGVCTNDDPVQNGALLDPSVNVTRGSTAATATVTLPAMVIRLKNSSGTEVPLPTGASLVVTDTGCNMNYATNAPTSTAGQSALQVNSSYGTGTGDYGILTYPGMPYGTYTVCYQTAANKSYTTPVFTNGGSGEIENIPTQSATIPKACP